MTSHPDMGGNDAKKKMDESQPSSISASFRQSAGRVCSMEFLKERLNWHVYFARNKKGCLPLDLGWVPYYSNVYFANKNILKVTSPCMGSFLRPGHAHWGLYCRGHHCPHRYTTGDRYIFILQIMIQNQKHCSPLSWE